jgi:hypothetical protein
MSEVNCSTQVLCSLRALHAPSQRAKRQPGAAAALSVVNLSCRKASQLAAQFTPAGLDTTLPSPTMVTATLVLRSTQTVTDCGPFIVTRQDVRF